MKYWMKPVAMLMTLCLLICSVTGAMADSRYTTPQNLLQAVSEAWEKGEIQDCVQQMLRELDEVELKQLLDDLRNMDWEAEIGALCQRLSQVDVEAMLQDLLRELESIDWEALGMEALYLLGQQMQMLEAELNAVLAYLQNFSLEKALSDLETGINGALDDAVQWLDDIDLEQAGEALFDFLDALGI